MKWKKDKKSYYNSKHKEVDTKTACTLLPYSILDLIKVDTTYLRTVILTASCYRYTNLYLDTHPYGNYGNMNPIRYNEE